jgi:DNA polymerase
METIRLAQGCNRCAELVANRQRIVHGYGPPSARVFLVGEAPGYKGADLTGVPFTCDRSGVRLQRVLIELGLSDEVDPRAERPRLHCFVTNVVRCNPPANRRPTRAEIDRCLPYLWQEIEMLRPEIIVPVGNVALQAVYPQLAGQPAPPITQVHARAFVQDGITILPMQHPARISNDGLARFVAAMRAALRALPQR